MNERRLVDLMHRACLTHERPVAREVHDYDEERAEAYRQHIRAGRTVPLPLALNRFHVEPNLEHQSAVFDSLVALGCIKWRRRTALCIRGTVKTIHKTERERRGMMHEGPTYYTVELAPGVFAQFEFGWMHRREAFEGMPVEIVGRPTRSLVERELKLETMQFNDWLEVRIGLRGAQPTKRCPLHEMHRCKKCHGRGKRYARLPGRNDSIYGGCVDCNGKGWHEP